MSVTTALVLAGHGSHISPNTAGLVWEQVDKLRTLNIADEVTAAFWKEMPSFHSVFNSLEATDITVVPLFTAQGYFTQTVIPAEMGLTGTITERDGKTIRYARTLGEHPDISNIIQKRIKTGMLQLNAPPEKTAVAIIGHSTRRNPESRKATEIQVEAIRQSGIVAEVVAIYLDDTPEIKTVYDITTAPNLVAVPYFLAEGSHTTIDVPMELGLGVTVVNMPQQIIKGRKVYYTQPIGNDVFSMILDMARETGASIPDRFPGKKIYSNGTPQVGKQDFIQTLQKASTFHFGQLSIASDASAEGYPYYRIAVSGESDYWFDTSDLWDVRPFIRENPFRPLATSKDLRTGWHIKAPSSEMAHIIVEVIYPGVIADWSAHREGTFRANTLVQTVARQTGQYRQLEQLTPVETQTIVKQVCANCVRHPTWFHGESPADVIPCAEPCNFWLSAAVKELTEKETE
jgi:sirohydrochlorin cobaltochelatase